MSIVTINPALKIMRDGADRTYVYKKSMLTFGTYFPLLWPSLMLGAFLAYYTVASMEWRTSFSPEIRAILPPSYQEKIGMGIFYWILYTVFIPAAVLIIVNLLRRKGRFTFTNDGIRIGRTLYPYKAIQGLYIKSPMGIISNTVTTNGMAFVVSGDRVQSIGSGAAAAVGMATTTVASAATQVSAASGRAIANSIRRKSFKICFLFGGREQTLVRQVSEKRVLEIFHGINSTIA